MITVAQFAKIMGGAKADVIAAWHAALVPEMVAAEVTTDARQAALMASIANETGSLRLLDEADLSYITTSWARIHEVFSGVRGLTPELVDSWRAMGRVEFDRHFLNHVYADANRGPGYGLGNVNPGDGFRFRGMGPGATTGRGNYTWMQRETNLPLVERPEMVKEPAAGAKIVCHFWKKNGCNQYVDDGSQAGFLKAMWKLNAGLRDFSHHLAYWEAAKRALANDQPDVAPRPLPDDKRKADVRAMQERLKSLGFDPGGIDGIAGPRTKVAIVAFQRARGLDVDGIVGPKTLAALGLT